VNPAPHLVHLLLCITHGTAKIVWQLKAAVLGQREDERCVAAVAVCCIPCYCSLLHYCRLPLHVLFCITTPERSAKIDRHFGETYCMYQTPLKYTTMILARPRYSTYKTCRAHHHCTTTTVYSTYGQKKSARSKQNHATIPTVGHATGIPS
jgi:hypothetical protein